MPSLEQNHFLWTNRQQWTAGGDQWSEPWGGVENQWAFAIHPRIKAFLPSDTILEIAPGHGRWTNYLRHHCKHVIVVDLMQECIDSCKRRFSAASHIEYHVNDGKSLSMIEDESIDFVFSFDSLVHVEADVIQSYLKQLGRKLKRNGLGFIHHSNIGQFRGYFEISKRIQKPYRLRKLLMSAGLLDGDNWRAFSMTAQIFEAFCERAGMVCISQELVNWKTKREIDCFSVFTAKGSFWARPNRVLKNRGFMSEAKHIRQLSYLYGGLCRHDRSEIDWPAVQAPEKVL